MAVEMIVDRAQHVGGMLDVLDGEMLEQVGNRTIARFQRLADRGVIFVRTADRLLEDRRIGGDALDAVGIDQLFQVALGDEAAGQEIQPDGLAVVFECFDGIHDALFGSSWPIIGFKVTSSGARPNCQQIRPEMPTRGICVSPQHNATHNISIPEIGGLAAMLAMIFLRRRGCQCHG